LKIAHDMIAPPEAALIPTKTQSCQR
jgi:hypothetical protein